MDNKTVKLSFPIKIKKDGADVECKELTFSRFKTKHLKLLPSDFVGKAKDGVVEPAGLLPLIAGLAGLDIKEAEEIDMSDFVLIMEEIQDFFGGFLMGTGKK